MLQKLITAGLVVFWATGAGAEMRRAMGTAVFSGMIGVTVVGLLMTPVFYVLCRWPASRKNTVANTEATMEAPATGGPAATP